ncbi:hypothetical protein GS907_02745 [Rhodococcus hoagii]|nr:hypothetical protein [Prescottella equi]
MAAALALALAAGGRRVLLVEVEGRQGIAQLFDVPPLPPQETKIATAEGGGEVFALAVDLETAFLEYLDMFYNLGFAGRAMKKIGAVDSPRRSRRACATCCSPARSRMRSSHRQGRPPVYDAVVVDAPPTGRIGKFLDVTRAMSELAKGGPIHSQSQVWCGCCTRSRPSCTW